MYSLFQFRIGSYLLPVNKLSNSAVERGDRLCSACNVLGDETHFIFDCHLLSELRMKFINNISESPKNLTVLRNPTYNMAKFIHHGLDIYRTLR